MAKYLTITLIALMAVTIIYARDQTCRRAGDRCVQNDDCCNGFFCHGSKLKCQSQLPLKGQTQVGGNQKSQGGSCKRHGDPCTSSSECCGSANMICHRFANRCQIQITKDELCAQREKVTGKKCGVDRK